MSINSELSKIYKWFCTQRLSTNLLEMSYTVFDTLEVTFLRNISKVLECKKIIIPYFSLFYHNIDYFYEV